MSEFPPIQIVKPGQFAAVVKAAGFLSCAHWRMIRLAFHRQPSKAQPSGCAGRFATRPAKACIPAKCARVRPGQQGRASSLPTRRAISYPGVG
jgi:hypothetical protein